MALKGNWHWSCPGLQASEFIDPQNPEAGLIPWDGNWRGLVGVYEFKPTLDNFSIIFRSLRITDMVRNTIILAIITEIGVLASSIVVAYGFARFPLPGGNLLFYLMIATILLPEKITLIPSYFISCVCWAGMDHGGQSFCHFLWQRCFIFLLRQNFKSIPKDLDKQPCSTVQGRYAR